MSKLPFPSPVLLLTLLLISVPFQVISQIPNTEEQTVLLNLKQQLGNPPSLTCWNATSSPCDWPGITCTDNSVTGVSLMNKTITEKIPPTICNLKNLTSLYVSYNNIPGAFPDILNCTRLQILDLSQNFFVGPIPSNIDRLSALRFIDVGANNFSGDIPSSIGRLSELQTLYLYQNQFNGTFPKEIGDLSNLEVLGMAYNEKFVPASIPVEFGKLKKLKTLWIAAANLRGEIPESLTNLTSLETLSLPVNNMTGPIPGGLFSLKNLTSLYLFSNRLSGELPNSFEGRNLVELDLSMNNLTGSIPEDFGKLQYLRLFNLFSNQFSGQLPASIGLMPSLTGFRVFENNLSGVLPPELGLHSKLEAFEVSSNQFSGQLPQNLCAAGVLTGVVAFSNNFSGEVPESLGNCSTLRTVQLYDNQFSSELPPGIWTTFNLSSLILNNNAFSGELPSELAWNLTRLEISNNRFSGQIPAGVASWKNMVVFKASNNLFSGEIPVELTSLSQLTTLLLDGNQLSSTLPSHIISWQTLTTLNLSRNELSGKIPAALGSLPDLLYLDLSGNQFSGVIPPELGDLRLNLLNLSSNKLSGVIPQGLYNLAYEDSFLNNSNLCVDTPVLNFPSCNTNLRDSGQISPRYLAMALTLAVFVLLVAILLGLFVVRDYQNKKRKQDLATWKLTSFHRLDFTEANILSNLTESNLIGSGGSGEVYRISINRSGEFVAVKRIWNNRKLDEKLEKEFIAEIEILGRIRHSNIVKLWCCISSENKKLLVYEYMENQSLDRWLHASKRSSISSWTNSVHHVALDWPTRLQIAIGAAQGLCYMHHGVGVLPGVARPPVPGIAGVRPIIPPVVRPTGFPVGTPAEKPETTVYVGKIASTADNDFMLSLLQVCGPVKSWKRPQHPSNGTLKGFGFCEFESVEAVLRALRLLSKFNIDGQELMLNVTQATRDYLERYVEKKTENTKKLRETQDAGSEKEDGSVQGVEKNDPPKASEDLKKDSEAGEKKNHDNSNFGIVTDEDREADQEAMEKLKSMIEDRLKANPLPPAPVQSTLDGSGSSNSELPVKIRDGDSDVDIPRNDVAEDKIDDETASDTKATSEHDRPETSSPDRSRTYDSRSRDRDRERGLKREKEREIDRYEREAEREHVRKEREQRRKIEEFEREYERCLKDWEYREREREKERQYEKEREKERERKRKKEILYGEEDEDDDSRKRWHRSVLEDKKRKRLREKEDDFSDKIKEEEEIAKAKKRAEEEQLQQQQRDALKLLSGHGSNGTENPSSAEESGVETKDKIAVGQDYDGYSIHENHVAGDEVLQNGTGDESTNASVSSLDMWHSSNAPARKLGFGLVGSGKRTAVPSVFHEEDDDDAEQEKKMRPLVPIDYSTEELQVSRPIASGANQPNLAAAAEFAKSISNVNSKEENPGTDRERSRRSHNRSSQREKDRSAEDSSRSRDENKEKILDRDRDWENGLDKVKTPDNKKLLDAKQLIDMIPKTKEELFAYEINWAAYDEHKLHERMRPWISKKIREFLGEEETTLVDYIVSSTQEHVKASQMLELLQTILDDEAEMFVLKMWRMLIFEIKKVETGLALRSRS